MKRFQLSKRLDTYQIIKTFSFQIIEEGKHIARIQASVFVQYVDVETKQVFHRWKERKEIVVWLINPFTEKKELLMVIHHGFACLENEDNPEKGELKILAPLSKYKNEDEEIKEAVIQFLLDHPKYRLKLLSNGYIKKI